MRVCIKDNTGAGKVLELLPIENNFSRRYLLFFLV